MILVWLFFPAHKYSSDANLANFSPANATLWNVFRFCFYSVSFSHADSSWVSQKLIAVKYYLCVRGPQRMSSSNRRRTQTPLFFSLLFPGQSPSVNLWPSSPAMRVIVRWGLWPWVTSDNVPVVGLCLPHEANTRVFVNTSSGRSQRSDLRFSLLEGARLTS